LGKGFHLAVDIAYPYKIWRL